MHIATGVATGGVGVLLPPIAPNNKQIRENILKIFYRVVALKELYSLLNIQLKGKYK